MDIREHIPNIEKLTVEQLDNLHEELINFLHRKISRQQEIREIQQLNRFDIHPVTKI
jgi:hypothetical protein